MIISRDSAYLIILGQTKLSRGSFRRLIESPPTRTSTTFREPLVSRKQKISHSKREKMKAINMNKNQSFKKNLSERKKIMRKAPNQIAKQERR